MVLGDPALLEVEPWACAHRAFAHSFDTVALSCLEGSVLWALQAHQMGDRRMGREKECHWPQ